MRQRDSLRLRSVQSSPAVRNDAAAGVLVELGRILVRLRREAGLSQMALAQRMGRTAASAQPLISRLETGREPNPGLVLVLDYLRACRAKPEEIVGVLRSYASRPLVVEEKGTEAVGRVVASLPRRARREVVRQDRREVRERRAAGEEPEPAAKRSERARKRAVGALRRERVRLLVERELTRENIGFRPSWLQRRLLLQHCDKVWAILLRTRRSRPETRSRLLAKSGDWLEGRVPEEGVEFVRFLAGRAFETMEQAGEFEKAGEPKPLAAGFESREEYQRKVHERWAARQRAMDSIIAEAHEFLRAQGVPDEKLGLYDHTVRFFCHVADEFPKESPARQRAIEAHVREERFVKRGRDAGLCRRVGELALERYAGLKAGFPPEPGRRGETGSRTAAAKGSA
ncbi:MAG: helix-turn-helix transcriptional regulator [candidate division WOR-3 bacterium]